MPNLLMNSAQNGNTKDALTKLFARLNIYLLIELLQSSSEVGESILWGGITIRYTSD